MDVTKTNMRTDIQTRTLSTRPSRRRELLELPWDRRRFSQHRARVHSAGARIDCSMPSTANMGHMRVKGKKNQNEKERKSEIQYRNEILLQHLASIAKSKRVDDGNGKKVDWKDHYMQILVKPRNGKEGTDGLKEHEINQINQLLA
eukprot:TRINITY_DN80623_c0_g1_i1.p1 TRINITY_DN80623_c0_g1~~TRINITY_DN80623_c0_g1_i1.p1  ORF type:complete len:146 (-),score=17.19 TRINITY_DN80623_c0_g1_i1:8-445(-)